MLVLPSRLRIDKGGGAVYKGLDWYDVEFHSSGEEKKFLDSRFNFVDLLFLVQGRFETRLMAGRRS